jgi:hypothetical protein
MKRATFNVLFYVKHSKKLKDGTLPIFARITINNFAGQDFFSQTVY